MSSKKKTTAPTNLPALTIGSRVRCTDDGVSGRITWANAASVKIKWDDGEQVTWKRDSLATRPIAILDADDTVRDEQPAAEPEQDTPTEPPAPAADTAPAQAHVTAPSAPEAATTDSPEPHAETPADEPVPPAPEQTESATPALAVDTPATAAPVKPKRQRKAKVPAEPKAKKLSALDAAARVLDEAGQAMTTQELIGVMAAKGYWSSPGGQTPAATLYSALLRELKVKGAQSRFVKAAPGRFAARPTA